MDSTRHEVLSDFAVIQKFMIGTENTRQALFPKDEKSCLWSVLASPTKHLHSAIAVAGPVKAWTKIPQRRRPTTVVSSEITRYKRSQTSKWGEGRWNMWKIPGYQLIEWQRPYLFSRNDGKQTTQIKLCILWQCCLLLVLLLLPCF